MWTYFGTLGVRGNERIDDLNLHVNNMYFWEIILFFTGLLGTVAMWIFGLAHSIKSRRIGWFFLVGFCWPLAFIYPWLHAPRNRNRSIPKAHSPNKGFNRTPESSRPAKPGEYGGGAG